MAMPTPQTVGANLTPVNTPVARRFSLALSELIHELQYASAWAKTLTTEGRLDCRVFTKAGAPVTNTAADSPGGNHCFIIDTSACVIYSIVNWASSTSFTPVEFLSA